jgi:hypothetical protein
MGLLLKFAMNLIFMTTRDLSPLNSAAMSMHRIAVAAICLATALETEAQITVLSESGSNAVSGTIAWGSAGNPGFSQSSAGPSLPITAAGSVTWSGTVSYPPEFGYPPFTQSVWLSATNTQAFGSTANSISASGQVVLHDDEFPQGPVDSGVSAQSSFEATFSVATPQSYILSINSYYEGLDLPEDGSCWSYALTSAGGSDLLSPIGNYDDHANAWAGVLNPGTYTLTMNGNGEAGADPAGDDQAGYYDMELSVSPIPEPSTFALFAIPFALQGIRYLRNRRRLG